jgi:hypothetical protein
MTIRPSIPRMQTRQNAIRLIGCSLLVVVPFMLRSPLPLFGRQAGTTSGSGVEKATPATHVLGLEHIKRGEKGRLAVVDKTLRFESGASTAEVSIPSIQDVFTGEESQELVRGKTGIVVELAMPYESSRVVSLLASHKIDILTVEYRDSNGGLHGVIFTLPEGQAPVLKRMLVEHGAHASLPPQAPAKPQP